MVTSLALTILDLRPAAVPSFRSMRRLRRRQATQPATGPDSTPPARDAAGSSGTRTLLQRRQREEVAISFQTAEVVELADTPS